MIDRTVHAAVGRYLACHSSFDNCEKPTLLRDDFSRAMHDFLPVAMREVTKSAPDSGRSGWDDVGGLVYIQKAIKEVCFTYCLLTLSNVCTFLFLENRRFGISRLRIL